METLVKRTLLCLILLLLASLCGAQQRVLVLAAEGFNADEYWRPHFLLKGAGLELQVASIKSGIVPAGNKHRILDIHASLSLAEVDPSQYAGLFIPGGHSPAHLVDVPEAIALIQAFDQEKPIASICHGPMLLGKAGLLQNTPSTFLLELRDEQPEMWKTGDFGHYLDEPLVRTRNLIMSRYPEDAEALGSSLIAALKPDLIGGGTARKLVMFGSFRAPRLKYAFRKGSIKAFDKLEMSRVKELAPDVETDLLLLNLPYVPSKTFVKDTLGSMLAHGTRILAVGENPIKHPKVLNFSLEEIDQVFRYLFEEEGLRLKDYTRFDLETPSIGVLLSAGFDEREWQELRVAFEVMGYQSIPISPAGGSIVAQNGFTLNSVALGEWGASTPSLFALLPHYRPNVEAADYTWAELNALQSEGRTLMIVGLANKQVFRETLEAPIRLSAPEQLRWSFPKGIKWQATPFTQTYEQLYTVQNTRGLAKLLHQHYDRFHVQP